MLDLEFVADADTPNITTDEDWEMSRDGVTVAASNDVIRVDDRGAHELLAWGPDLHLRGYTPTDFARRIGAGSGFDIEAWYPEATRETGVTEFAHEPTGDRPGVGRGMVVLRKQ